TDLIAPGFCKPVTGQIQYRCAATYVPAPRITRSREISGAAESCISRQSNFLERVLLADTTAIDNGTVPTYASSCNINLFRAKVGIIGGGISAKIKRAAVGNSHRTARQSAKRIIIFHLQRAVINQYVAGK